MSTRTVGGPRGGETLSSTITDDWLNCADIADPTHAVLRYKQSEPDPDGTAVYIFDHGEVDGRTMTDAELNAYPPPHWDPVNFG